MTETATNRLVELDIAQARPHSPAVFSTVRHPNSVTVDSRTGTVYVTGGAGGVVQVLSAAARRHAAKPNDH